MATFVHTGEKLLDKFYTCFVGPNRIDGLYTEKKYSKNLTYSKQTFKFTFIKQYIVITDLSNDITNHKCFKLLFFTDGNSEEVILSITHRGDMRYMKITNFADDGQLADKTLYTVLFNVEHWKNSSYDVRTNAEQRIQNLVGVISGQIVPITKLTKEEAKTYGVELANQDDKAFIMAFYLRNDPTMRIEQSTITNISTFLSELLPLVWDSNCQHVYGIKAHQMPANEVGPEWLAKIPTWIQPPDDDYRETLTKHLIYLKPNGIMKFQLFLDELKFDRVHITKIFVCEPTDARIRYFYPNAHAFLYGQHWYQYLKKTGMIFIEFYSNLTIEEMAKVKAEFRKKSQLNWTLNVCHMAVDEEEMKHFENFFDKQF